MLWVNANFTKASIDCGASTVPTNDSEEEEGCYEIRVLQVGCSSFSFVIFLGIKHNIVFAIGS